MFILFDRINLYTSDLVHSGIGEVGSEATCRSILKVSICIFACKF